MLTCTQRTVDGKNNTQTKNRPAFGQAQLDAIARMDGAKDNYERCTAHRIGVRFRARARALSLSLSRSLSLSLLSAFCFLLSGHEQILVQQLPSVYD